MHQVIVAIDGPSGVGKTTTSRSVARALGVPHIDTGAMYRAIAVRARLHGVSETDEDALAKLAADAVIEFRGDELHEVWLDGMNVSAKIREPEISMAASRVSAVPSVRRVLVRLQQELGRRNGGVLEGRDIGTHVFPDTPHKYFLTARPEERGLRRFLELQNRGSDATLDQVIEEMTRRDMQDESREDSPLQCDDSYHLIDTSDLSPEDVVDLIVREVIARSGVRS